MSMDLERRIQEIVATELQVSVDKVVPGMSLRKGLGMDSVAAVNIIFAVEEEFGVRVPEKELEHVDTVDSILALLRKLIDSVDSSASGASRQDASRSERAS
jgi:acyl carrier protein